MLHHERGHVGGLADWMPFANCQLELHDCNAHPKGWGSVAHAAWTCLGHTSLPGIARSPSSRSPAFTGAALEGSPTRSACAEPECQAAAGDRERAGVQAGERRGPADAHRAGHERGQAERLLRPALPGLLHDAHHCWRPNSQRLCEAPAPSVFPLHTAYQFARLSPQSPSLLAARQSMSWLVGCSCMCLKTTTPTGCLWRSCYGWWPDR